MTPRQRHLLYILAEEAAEVVQAATKLLRFGDRVIPEGHAGAGVSNVEHLATELDDLEAVHIMLSNDGMELPSRDRRIAAKMRRVNVRIAESLQIEEEAGREVRGG